MASTVSKFSGMNTTSRSRLSESRTPVSSSDVVFPSGSSAESWTSSLLMYSLMTASTSLPSSFLALLNARASHARTVDLAGGGPWQRRAELHHVRHHVPRQPPAAVVEDLLAGQP